MSDANSVKSYNIDSVDNIVAAILAHEDFEVIGCGDDMSAAVRTLEKCIESQGLRCRIYTKGRTAALAGLLVPTGVTQLVGLASAVGMAAHNIATYGPDYEIMKRPVDHILVVRYAKNPSQIARFASDVADSVAEVWDKHVPSKEAVVAATSTAAQKMASAASEAAGSISDAWNAHTPSKEAVVGAIAVGGLGAAVLHKNELETIGDRVISSASEAASTLSDAAGAVATAVKENPGAAALGAVVGVGAVAAAPFTGGGSVLGAATLASSLAGAGGVAAAVGVGGAGAGVAISSFTTNRAHDAAFAEGVAKGKADSAVTIEKLTNMMERAAQIYSAQKKLNEFILCCAAVGFGMAACDGPITEKEKAYVEEFVVGMAKFALPEDVRIRLRQMLDTPPNFDQALPYLSGISNDIWPAIDGLLEVIGSADGDVNQQEREFFAKWEAYKLAKPQ